MDRVTSYSTQIQKILSDYLKDSHPNPPKPGEELEYQLIVDTQHHHYQLLVVGWQKQGRNLFPIFHLDIKNGKIWVQEAASEFDIVGELEKSGVPKSDIVLGFHSPYMRQFTEYGVA